MTAVTSAMRAFHKPARLQRLDWGAREAVRGRSSGGTWGKSIPGEGLSHSRSRKEVNVATAKMRSECKSNTENLERTQRFSPRWEETEAKALD